mmetsp:Transcript_83954/g.271697  ORF Transcript_83954/g.271697 Transcript_83954/m.271697 type:complete len:236 (+) Transcript_83954:713-1420(+)
MHQRHPTGWRDWIQGCQGQRRARADGRGGAAASVHRNRGRQAGLPALQERCAVRCLWSAAGPWCAGGRLWHHRWPGLLDRQELVGEFVGTGRLRPAASWQGRRRGVRDPFPGLLPCRVRLPCASAGALAGALALASASAVLVALREAAVPQRRGGSVGARHQRRAVRPELRLRVVPHGCAPRHACQAAVHPPRRFQRQEVLRACMHAAGQLPVRCHVRPCGRLRRGVRLSRRRPR